jgi:dTDP-4-amino-4,6-dideoxygalactose transaminase
MPHILAIAEAHRLPVIEDAACALGSEIRMNDAWQPIGRPLGRVACFSLHPRKVVTVGDGGVLTTADPALDARFKLLRQHGMDVPDTIRHGSPQVIFERYPVPGFNYRLTDIQAAIGIEQLRRLPGIVAARRQLAAAYAALLAGMPGVTPPAEPGWARSNWQSYCVRLPPGSDQRRIMQRMLDRGIATRRGIMCIHREPAHAEVPLPWPLPRSESAQRGCILLPLFPGMTPAMQAEVVEALRDALTA